MGQFIATKVAGSDSGLRDALVAANLPTEDLTDGGRRFFRFDLDGRPVGYGGFEPHGAYALLRSVVVLPEARGTGVGRAVAEGVLQKAAAEKCSEAFLLTTTAEGFFQHIGFHEIDRALAPKEILATKQAATICATATLLARRLDG
ncbi:MAG: arsenic resistance N-acetyltransferase ArsN2 [Devosia sp.]